MQIELTHYEHEYRKTHEYQTEHIEASGISDFHNHENHLRKHHEEMEDRKHHLDKIHHEILRHRQEVEEALKE